ncbi:MAG TPA: family 20 glycosylhydrolase [Vicinamibacteria bacterium]|nr:family 20 glycosylhydrolase [Vicinamibacteria bacterium]
MSIGVLAVAVAAVAAVASGGERPALMPWPASVEMGTGELALVPGFRVSVSGRGGALVERAAARFQARLARQTGLVLPDPVTEAKPAGLSIRCDGPGRALPHLGMDEAYTLTVTPEGANLQAAEPWGVLRGLETFLQLVTPGRAGQFRAPALVVRDRPRFAWRGLMLDCGRHFLSLDTVRRTLDAMAAVKLNTLHWHLTEDQGFRVESRRYPELQRMGSDGLFYTQQQVKDTIAYAAERGIRVYPEFDLPGHTTSWFVGHPELATAPGPYRIERRWGVFDPAMDPSKEEVYRLLEGFLGEMAALFPDPVLHIGGDENRGRAWDASERVQAFKRQKGLATNHDLQAYFNQRLSKIVTGHGKQMMGWDEILHPGLPQETIVHSWRGQESLGAAAKQGFRGVLSYGYYVDLIWPARQHYLVDPWDKGVEELPEADRARILGGEATMWSEYVNDETVDSRIWPRTAAIAERLWSPREVRDVEDMYARLEPTSRWLEWLGLDHRAGYPRMLERLAGARASELRLLADVVEPVKNYQRGRTRAYTQQTPLNALVDAARPESEAAREFDALVDALLADPARRTGVEAIRARLAGWQATSGRLLPLLESSTLLRDAVPTAAQAEALAAAGLEALAFLELGVQAPPEWASERAPLLAAPKPPPSALEVAFRPSVQKLVRAAASVR